MVRKAIIALAGLLLIGGLLWRSAPAAGEGEVLVLPARAVAGPARLWIAPWSARAVLPARVEVSVGAVLDLGQGSSWPVTLDARLDLVPAQMTEPARLALVHGPASFREEFAAWARSALSAVAERSDVDPREVLFRPGALSGAARAALGPLVPAGIVVDSLEAAVDVQEDEARRNSLTVVRSSQGRDPLARVLYIGLDGADWEIIDPLVQRGLLPVLDRLVREGARADLLSYEPMMSPLLWNSAVTGQGPDAHGIFDFTLADGEGNKVPIGSTWRKSPAVWEILSAWGDLSAFVNFWATDPAEEIDGVLVSDIAKSVLRKKGAGAKLPPGVVWPTDFLEQVPGLWSLDDVPLAALRTYVPSATEAEFAEAQAYWGEERPEEAEGASEKGERKIPPLPFLLQLAANTHNLERITEYLLERPEFGVVGVYFGDIDQVGHNFQHLAPPPHPLADPEERRRFHDVVENCYRQQDAMLGRLLQAADEETVVLIHSDHGFCWGARRPRDVMPFTRGQPVEWHRMHGMFLAAGGPVRRGVRLPDVTLYDIVPTILALRGVPPAENMRGRVREDLFEPQAAARLPQARVPDWNALVPPRQYAVAASAEELDAVRQEMVAELRALGYVGGGPDDVEEEGGAVAAEGGGEEEAQVTYYRTKATWMMNENRFAEAEQALLEANRVELLPRTFSLLSEARAAQGDVAGAVAALEEGFEQFPDRMPASAVLWMVELELQREDLPAARRALERGRAIADGETAPLIVAQGRIAEAEGDAAAARREYLRALDADPREVRAAQRYAALAPSAQDRLVLAPYLQRALQQDPRIEVYWHMLGLIRMDQGDPAGAADAFREAAILDPADQRNATNEAVAALQAGQRERARRILEALAATGSREPGVWANLGNVRAADGDWAGAGEAWQRAVALGADSPRLRQAIEEARRRTSTTGR